MLLLFAVLEVGVAAVPPALSASGQTFDGSIQSQKYAALIRSAWPTMYGVHSKKK